MIANTIIASTLRKLMVVAVGSTPTTAQYTVGLEALNDLIKLWSANSSLIYQDTKENISISAGEQEFTLGATGDHVTAKPFKVLNASILEDGIEYVLKEADANVYERFYDKTIIARPEWLYFRNTHPNSTFYFDVTADVDYTLILTSMKELSEFPDGTTDVSLPGYYETAFKHNLVISLASEMGAANRVTQLMMQLADNSKSEVIGRAVKIRVSTTELSNYNRYERFNRND